MRLTEKGREITVREWFIMRAMYQDPRGRTGMTVEEIQEAAISQSPFASTGVCDSIAPKWLTQLSDEDLAQLREWLRMEHDNVAEFLLAKIERAEDSQ